MKERTSHFTFYQTKIEKTFETSEMEEIQFHYILRAFFVQNRQACAQLNTHSMTAFMKWIDTGKKVKNSLVKCRSVFYSIAISIEVS